MTMKLTLATGLISSMAGYMVYIAAIFTAATTSKRKGKLTYGLHRSRLDSRNEFPNLSQALFTIFFHATADIYNGDLLLGIAQ